MVTLKGIPYAVVEEALDKANKGFCKTREYNTSCHTREETAAVLRNITHCGPEEQPWVLLQAWLDPVMTSRILHEHNIDRIVLPGAFLVLLSYTSQVALQLGRIPKDDAEDSADAFPKTHS